MRRSDALAAVAGWLRLSALQILPFLLLAHIGWALGNALHGSLRGGIGAGMLFYFAHPLFAVLALLHGVSLWRWPAGRLPVVSALLCTVLFTLYFAPVWSSHPYRSLLLIGVGALCFSLPLLISRLRALLQASD